MKYATENVVAWLKAHPDGGTRHDIAAGLGLSPTTMKSRLTICFKAGTARKLNNGTWCATEFYPALKEAMVVSDRHRRRLRQRNMRRAIVDGVDDYVPPFVHRIIPANQAPPIVTKAVSSVWELAA
jgi:hypothetical protein